MYYQSMGYIYVLELPLLWKNPHALKRTEYTCTISNGAHQIIKNMEAKSTVVFNELCSLKINYIYN